MKKFCYKGGIFIKLKHKDLLFSETLPKREGMKSRFKNNAKTVKDLRNYVWEWFYDYNRKFPRSYHKKYRKHGQYNGKKPLKKEKVRKVKQFYKKYRKGLLEESLKTNNMLY